MSDDTNVLEEIRDILKAQHEIAKRSDARSEEIVKMSQKSQRSAKRLMYVLFVVTLLMILTRLF